jgi:hypothetical protein
MTVCSDFPHPATTLPPYCFYKTGPNRTGLFARVLFKLYSTQLLTIITTLYRSKVVAGRVYPTKNTFIILYFLYFVKIYL